ncbi:MAG: hypothetical protein DMG76_30730 [Acidobacteria bacterium]|nr:MAG: hypothetical protein DMG76_30730 [Acidobacteriota bacterium]
MTDAVPRVNFATAGGSIDWNADGSGFYYARYPQGNERPPEDANFFQQVYFHKLGADAKEDGYVIGKDLPRIAEIQLHTSDDGRWLVAAVANGDRGQFAHYLMDAAGHWTQLTRSTTELSQRKWDPMILSIFFRAKTLRAGRFCDYRYPNWNSRRRRSSLPRVLAPVLTRAAARRLKTSNPLLAGCT